MNTKNKGIGIFIATIVVISVVAVICIPASANQNFYFRVIDTPGDSSDANAPSPITQDNGEFYLDVNKTVLDTETGEWVKEIDARVGDNVTFRISGIIENYPNFCGGGWNITQFAKNFTLSEEWSYDIFYIYFPMISIYYDDNNSTMNTTFNATVVGCGVGYNTLNWTVICPETGEIATDEETVKVNVICSRAPALTPIGLIALISMLSAIAALTITKRKRR